MGLFHFETRRSSKHTAEGVKKSIRAICDTPVPTICSPSQPAHGSESQLLPASRQIHIGTEIGETSRGKMHQDTGLYRNLESTRALIRA